MSQPESLLLVAPLPSARALSQLPSGYSLRPPTPADAQAMAGLYLAAYPPGIACATLAESEEEIRATFAGDYGDLWPGASALIEHRDPSGGRDPTLAAVVLTVHRAPWEGTPACPFIIELFTAPDHRRRGLGRAALTHACNTAFAAGETAIALRVATDNDSAIALYRSSGFATLPSADPGNGAS